MEIEINYHKSMEETLANGYFALDPARLGDDSPNSAFAKSTIEYWIERQPEMSQIMSVALLLDIIAILNHVNPTFIQAFAGALADAVGDDGEEDPEETALIDFQGPLQ